MDNIQPWEQQEGETPRAFGGFQVYKDLGPSRSLNAVAEDLFGKKKAKTQVRTVSRWSSKWRWVERARAWDRYATRQANQASLKERRRQGKQAAEWQANQARALMAVCLAPADALQKKIQRAAANKEEGLEGLGVKDLGWLAMTAGKIMPGLIKAERLARGMDDDADDGLTVEEFSALVGELWEFCVQWIPQDKLRKAKGDFFRILRKYGANAEDAGA